jgi:hypothetical protein
LKRKVFGDERQICEALAVWRCVSIQSVWLDIISQGPAYKGNKRKSPFVCHPAPLLLSYILISNTQVNP